MLSPRFVSRELIAKELGRFQLLLRNPCFKLGKDLCAVASCGVEAGFEKEGAHII